MTFSIYQTTGIMALSSFIVRFHKNKIPNLPTWLTFASHPDEFLILHLILQIFVYLRFLGFCLCTVNSKFFILFSSLVCRCVLLCDHSYSWVDHISSSSAKNYNFSASFVRAFLFHEKVRIQKKLCQEDFIRIWNSSLINNWPLSRIWNSFWGQASISGNTIFFIHSNCFTMGVH